MSFGPEWLVLCKIIIFSDDLNLGRSVFLGGVALPQVLTSLLPRCWTMVPTASANLQWFILPASLRYRLCLPGSSHWSCLLAPTYWLCLAYAIFWNCLLASSIIPPYYTSAFCPVIFQSLAEAGCLQFSALTVNLKTWLHPLAFTCLTLTARLQYSTLAVSLLGSIFKRNIWLTTLFCFYYRSGFHKDQRTVAAAKKIITEALDNMQRLLALFIEFAEAFDTNYHITFFGQLSSICFWQAAGWFAKFPGCFDRRVVPWRWQDISRHSLEGGFAFCIIYQNKTLARISQISPLSLP